MIIKKIKYFFLVLLLCTISYFWGRADKQVSIMEKRIETKKNVQQKTAKIYAQPNAQRDALLKLMHNNEL